MYYGAIKECDIANGTGCRVSLFVSGCTNHCKGCFQPETWDFEYGEPFTEKTLNHLLTVSDRSWIQGLSVLGGDPAHPKNWYAVYYIMERFKEAFPDKDIWLYTGYDYEELLKAYGSALELIDVIVDGRFVEELKDISLKFRGSSNQRIIDVQKSLQNGKVELMDIEDRKLAKEELKKYRW